MEDVDSGWQEGDFTRNLPDQGSVDSNWARNARELQYRIGSGVPIRDVSPLKGGALSEGKELDNR